MSYYDNPDKKIVFTMGSHADFDLRIIGGYFSYDGNALGNSNSITPETDGFGDGNDYVIFPDGEKLYLPSGGKKESIGRKIKPRGGPKK
jgi:hypothetical protein